MDDIFNFKLHIKEIITPIMKNLGFKKTNLNFTRSNGRYLEKIVLQKSQFNLAASEKTIFVNYGRLALSIITRRKYQLIDVN